MKKVIDLRSDASTLPTEEMRESVSKALLGDDILGEDPTVKELEQTAASMLGMEDALLTSSGTMSNQIAVMVLTDRGDEVIMGRDSHMYNLEVAGLATLSQVQPRVIPVEKGYYNTTDIEEAIHSADVQIAKTGLISLENTYNLNEGSVVTLENMAEINQLAKKYDIPIFLDGARIFNAAAYLGVEAKAICEHVDAVQFCLTKGLGCPVGSLLLGTKSFIKKAKRIRQRLGGGMRQAGVIAAPGIIGLNKMVDRIKDDQETANQLKNAFQNLPGVKLVTEELQTNIVSIEVVKENWTADTLIKELKKYNILVKKIGPKKARLVTHYQITDKEINQVINGFHSILK